MQGEIRALRLDLGYGFIHVAAGQKDTFFHMSELVDLPFDERLEHQRVEFDVQPSEKGPRATNVRPIQ